MHPLMAVDIDECVEKTHLKKKITAIIPTSNSDIEFMIWSVFSMLLRNKPNSLLEHICVNINGPDKRTGSEDLQDKKQAFLEDLRDVEWSNGEFSRPMPLTVIRAWSRVGYAEAFEMALGWIHTDSYLLMHDDVILTNKNFCTEVEEKFYSDDDVALAYTPHLLGCKTEEAIHKGMYMITLPQLYTTFILAKKKWVMKAKALWSSYHIPSDDNFLQFELNELNNLEEFYKYHKENENLPKKLQEQELYNFVKQGIGSWVYYNLKKINKKFVKLDESNILHFEQMSSPAVSLQRKEEKLENNKATIKALEEEILAHPEFSKIYIKHMPKGALYA